MVTINVYTSCEGTQPGGAVQSGTTPSPQITVQGDPAQTGGTTPPQLTNESYGLISPTPGTTHILPDGSATPSPMAPWSLGTEEDQGPPPTLQPQGSTVASGTPQPSEYPDNQGNHETGGTISEPSGDNPTDT
jgi:hypothetical protein